MKFSVVHTPTLTLTVILLGLILEACGGTNGPVSELVPQGVWSRTTTMQDGSEHLSRLVLRRDSATFTDSIFTFPGGVRTLDSTHSAVLELSSAGDGYLRAMEAHSFSGSDISVQRLRYWYFFVRDNKLYFYNGIRLRGHGINIVGDWTLAEGDSAFLGASYDYNFDDTKVTVTRNGSGGKSSATYSYSTVKDTLDIEGNDLPAFGDRFEVVPGLALYLTSHRESGYVRIGF